MGANLTYRNLADIQRIYKSNPGGFYKMIFIPVQQMGTIGKYNRSTGTISIASILPGYQWYTAYLPMQRKAFTEQQREGDGGPYMDITVDGFVPYESIQNRVLMNLMKYHRFVVILIMPDGITRIIGNRDNGARFSHSYDSAQDFRGVPGTNIVFTWQNEDIAPIYDGPPF